MTRGTWWKAKALAITEDVTLLVQLLQLKQDDGFIQYNTTVAFTTWLIISFALQDFLSGFPSSGSASIKQIYTSQNQKPHN